MQPNSKFVTLAAITGLISVILGAMGAHGQVHDLLVAKGKLESWEVGVRYHLPHAMLLYLLALFSGAGGKRLTRAWLSLFLGVIFFSGSIYLLAYFGWKWLGPVTPLGGLLLMVGWLQLAFIRWQRD
jgi:uncharacterized membrane protein YgdD (TMEM256/DUF423 family)